MLPAVPSPHLRKSATCDKLVHHMVHFSFSAVADAIRTSLGPKGMDKMVCITFSKNLFGLLLFILELKVIQSNLLQSKRYSLQIELQWLYFHCQKPNKSEVECYLEFFKEQFSFCAPNKT